jgi:hypothetical protein
LAVFLKVVQLDLKRLFAPVFTWLSLKNIRNIVPDILPEVISTVSAISISKNLELLTFCCLFTAIAILIRLIWNSAILIHGLGHVSAIAIVARRLAAFSISNILEHRSIGTILKSMLPFNPIFIPGFKGETKLWIAAGNITPWQVRVKAVGGICLNLLAIARSSFFAIAQPDDVDVSEIMVRPTKSFY